MKENRAKDNSRIYSTNKEKRRTQCRSGIEGIRETMKDSAPLAALGPHCQPCGSKYRIP